MNRIKTVLKRSYVAGIRLLGKTAYAVGLLGWLEARQEKRVYHWLRSLFAIYDVDQMIKLDVPWWTYKAIDEVDRFLASKPDAAVFEYGSGASTVWLAQRAGTVHSVEHDSGWFTLMQSKIAPFGNVELVHRPSDSERNADPLFHSRKENYEGRSFADYVNAITMGGIHYDVIVIDGRARPACLAVAQSNLAPGGLIVFDNTKRVRYDKAIRASGLLARHFSGLTPSLPYPDKTTLLEANTSTANG